MTRRTEIDVGESLADAEVVKYYCQDSVLVVTVRTWQNQLCKIVFYDVLGIVDKGVSDISALCESDEESSFYRDVMDFNYEHAPNTHPYKLYQILGVADDVAMEILAKRVSPMELNE